MYIIEYYSILSNVIQYIIKYYRILSNILSNIIEYSILFHYFQEYAIYTYIYIYIYIYIHIYIIPITPDQPPWRPHICKPS